MNKHVSIEDNTDRVPSQVVNDWLPRMQRAGISPALVMNLIENVGDWSNWCQIWSDEAKSKEKQGVQAEQQGHMVTAGEAYLQASLLYHFAQFNFFVDLKQKTDAAEHKVTLYQSAAPFLQPPAIHIEIPYNGGSIKGYLRGCDAKHPDIAIIISGISSTKEEFSALENLFLKRGLATLSIDGPGQGEGREIGPLTPDWTPPIHAIVNMLRERSASGRIGLVGMAFGGHLALRAAHIPEIDAVVAVNGFFDLGTIWENLTGTYLANLCYIFKTNSLEQAAKLAGAFTLQDAPPPSCPALVIHGSRDNIFEMEDAEKIGPWSHGKVDLRIQNLDSNIFQSYRPMIADWLADRLIRPL